MTTEKEKEMVDVYRTVEKLTEGMDSAISFDDDAIWLTTVLWSRNTNKEGTSIHDQVRYTLEDIRDDPNKVLAREDD